MSITINAYTSARGLCRKNCNGPAIGLKAYLTASATPMTVVTCVEASQVGNAIIAITNHWVGSLKKLPSASRLKSAKVSAMALH